MPPEIGSIAMNILLNLSLKATYSIFKFIANNYKIRALFIQGRIMGVVLLVTQGLTLIFRVPVRNTIMKNDKD
jgi:hypothetical protein